MAPTILLLPLPLALSRRGFLLSFLLFLSLTILLLPLALSRLGLLSFLVLLLLLPAATCRFGLRQGVPLARGEPV
jgi:hypothetical protein